MKIIQIVAAYKPAYIYGGPTMSVAKLCENLVEQGIWSKEQGTRINEQQTTNNEIFELEVFTTTANGKEELPVEANKANFVDGVKVTYFKRLTKDHTHFSPTLLWGLRKEIIRCVQHDETLVIHIHAWWNLVSILSCAIAKWYKIPVIISPRGMLTAYTTNNRNSLAKQIIHSILGKNLLRDCHIHVTSEKEKRDVLSIITPKNITVIPNLVELSGYKPQQLNNKQQKSKDQLISFEEEYEMKNPDCLIGGEQTLPALSAGNNAPFKLIFLSRIEEKKGLDLLFEALTNLPFEWKLTIAGSGEEKYVESLKKKAEILTISDRMNWLGQVKNKDKFNLLAEHDLMVLTSYNENFANVVIESLSVGTPVLLSNEVGLADDVKEKKLGWITDLKPENIKNNIITAFESVNSRAQITAIAPQIITKDYDSRNLIQKYFNLYAKINNVRL